MGEYDNMSPIPDSLLKADGSITTFSGVVISGPSAARAEEYKSRSPLADKILHPDGSITTGIGESGGSGGALYVPDEFIFADDAARDAYFSANPGDLQDGIYCLSAGLLQKYALGEWTDGTAAIQGPKGDDGTVVSASFNISADGSSSYMLVHNFGDAFAVVSSSYKIGGGDWRDCFVSVRATDSNTATLIFNEGFIPDSTYTFRIILISL
ncbi:hypothetical protein FACS189490_12070 [Clostridia bacterium]|nr:hypothetical protein FACS189490_12070 [Clostridia bacterium]